MKDGGKRSYFNPPVGGDKTANTQQQREENGATRTENRRQRLQGKEVGNHSIPVITKRTLAETDHRQRKKEGVADTYMLRSNRSRVKGSKVCRHVGVRKMERQGQGFG